jgi:hypothetical protein
VIAVRTGLGAAVLRTLAYADVFDFALTSAELHRYLVGVRATPHEVALAVADLGDAVVARHGLVALAGRDGLLDLRTVRRHASARMWPAALRYAQAVGSLPFVRMVAVTGALACGNATDDGDIDLMVVTAPDRLWLARAATILVVRHASGRGDELCPNYFVADHLLELDPRDLYGAHELAQMVPVTGLEVYRRLRATNQWSFELLPNAGGPPFRPPSRQEVLRRLRPLAEGPLRTPLGSAVERWERTRKVTRLRSEAIANGGAEAAFDAHRCKGHLDGHATRIRDEYERRVRSLGLEPSWS